MDIRKEELFPHDLKTALKYSEKGYLVSHFYMEEEDILLENPTQIINFITESKKKTCNTEAYNMFWVVIPKHKSHLYNTLSRFNEIVK